MRISMNVIIFERINRFLTKKRLGVVVLPSTLTATAVDPITEVPAGKLKKLISIRLRHRPAGSGGLGRYVHWCLLDLSNNYNEICESVACILWNTLLNAFIETIKVLSIILQLIYNESYSY